MIGAVLGALVGLALLSPLEQSQEALAPFDDAARTTFGREKSVGQSFVPLPGMREVRLPVGRSEGVKGPLILHIRKDYFGEDVRTAVVFEPKVESEDIVFTFPPIREPAPQLLWVLEAPHGPHNAYWVYRELDTSAFQEGTALIIGDPVSGNYAFVQVGVDRAYRRLGQQLVGSFTGWERRSVALFIIGTLGFRIISRRLPHWGSGDRRWILLFVVLTVVLHGWLSMRLPIIIDEGAYLQDAWQSSLDRFPFRDFLTKGPIYIFLLKVWQIIAPQSMAAWRLMSALAWGGVVWLSAVLARRVGLSGRVQVVVAALMALLPGVAAASTPLLLQVVSTCLVVAALVMLLKGLQEERNAWVIGAGVVMTAAFLTRVSSVAAAAASLALILMFAKRRLRVLVVYAFAGVMALGVATMLALMIMGPGKTAVMLNLEAVLVGQAQTSALSETEPVIRWLTEASLALWRGGTWLLAGMVWFPLIWAKNFSRNLRWIMSAGWLLVIGNAAWHLRDMDYGLPAPLLAVRLTLLFVVFGLPLLWLMKSLGSEAREKQNDFSWRWIIVCAVWLAVLTMVYRFWGVFRATYIVEFLPPAVLLAAVALTSGLSQVMQRKFAQATLAGLVLASWWQGISLLVEYPVSGTVAVGAAESMVHLVARHVPESEEVFTAQPVITALAQRSIVRGYSHPGWIRAERVGRLPTQLRSVYFGDESEITRILESEVKFVVTDQRTNEIYFDGYPDRQKILVEQFEMIGEVLNDLTEEPFRLYRRK